MTDPRRGSDRPGGGEEDLLRRAKALAGRGRRTVEELARKVLGRVKGGGDPLQPAVSPAEPGTARPREARRKETASRPGGAPPVAEVKPAAPSKAKTVASAVFAPAAPAKAAPTVPAEIESSPPESSPPESSAPAAPAKAAPTVPAGIESIPPGASPPGASPPGASPPGASPPGASQPERWALTGGHAAGLEPEALPALSWVDLPPDERPATVEDFTPEELAGVDVALPELPERYDDLRVVLLARDPGWLYAYWDLSAEVRERLRARQGALALRLHDVTDLEFDGTQSWWRSLHWLPPESSHVYLPAPASGRTYLVELGLYEEAAPDRAAPRFLSLVRSDGALVPEAGPSPDRDEVFTALPTEGPPRAPESLPAPKPREGTAEVWTFGAREPLHVQDAAWEGSGGGPLGAPLCAGEGLGLIVPGNGRSPFGAPALLEAPLAWSGVHAPGEGGPGSLESPPPWSGLHAPSSFCLGQGEPGEAGSALFPQRGRTA